MLIEDILNETYINLIGDDPRKREYADEVYAMLQQAYAPIGGIKGSGFESPQDMIENIPFWKLIRRNGRIVAGTMYKDRGGRKAVASFTDGKKTSRDDYADMVKDEGTRAYKEVSDRALGFLIKLIGVDGVEQQAIEPSEAEQILGKKLYYPVPNDDPHVKRQPTLAKFFYQRYIGKDKHTKIMLGTPGKTIR